MTYPEEAVHEEVVLLGLHLGWSRDDVLDLEHRDRLRYLALVDRLLARPRG